MSNIPSSAPPPHLVWDSGTAYDLFLSLGVLHQPEKFGLRASWAAGVRSRLPADARRALEEADRVLHVPFHWLYSLPGPHNAAGVLSGLSALSPDQRLPSLALPPTLAEPLQRLLQHVAARRSWTPPERTRLRELLLAAPHNKSFYKDKELGEILDTWADAPAFGARFLEALQSYYQAFFAEEERRIEPYLAQALNQAQKLASQLSLPELLEALSQGLYLPGLATASKLVLVPSFWITPLVYLGDIDSETSVMAFGARPVGASLVPGESVPDALLQALKAMADPSRLRILRYLSAEQLTQVELSRRLRLRAPTLTHHLSALRLAGLVHITVDRHAERRYSARLEAVQAMVALLEKFLPVADRHNELEENNAQNKSA